MGCLFILFIVPYAMQKLLSWIRFHLFIFGFIFITQGGGPKNILLWFKSEFSDYVFLRVLERLALHLGL